jgi:hypothetical protein
VRVAAAPAVATVGGSDAIALDRGDALAWDLDRVAVAVPSGADGLHIDAVVCAPGLGLLARALAERASGLPAGLSGSSRPPRGRPRGRRVVGGVPSNCDGDTRTGEEAR